MTEPGKRADASVYADCVVYAGYTRVRDTGRRWPRWWCWLLGHEPTERSERMKRTRCRCGQVVFADEYVWTALYDAPKGGTLLAAGGYPRRTFYPRRWTRIVGRLP